MKSEETSKGSFTTADLHAPWACQSLRYIGLLATMLVVAKAAAFNSLQEKSEIYFTCISTSQKVWTVFPSLQIIRETEDP